MATFCHFISSLILDLRLFVPISFDVYLSFRVKRLFSALVLLSNYSQFLITLIFISSCCSDVHIIRLFCYLWSCLL